MGSIGVPVRAFFVESRKPFIAKKEYNEKNIRIVSIQFRFRCYTGRQEKKETFTDLKYTE